MSKTTRVSHLTFAKALARLVSGPSTAGDIQDVTGLHRSTISRLMHSLVSARAVHVCGKRADLIGRKSIPEYRIGPDPKFF